jgi:hypothetical protein
VKSTNGAGSVDAVSTANTTTATSARYIRVRYHTGSVGTRYTLKFTW